MLAIIAIARNHDYFTKFQETMVIDLECQRTGSKTLTGTRPLENVIQGF